MRLVNGQFQYHHRFIRRQITLFVCGILMGAMAMMGLGWMLQAIFGR